MAYNPLIQMLSFVLYSTQKICIIYIIFVPDYKKYMTLHIENIYI